MRDLLAFDASLFASVLIEEHEATYLPPVHALPVDVSGSGPDLFDLPAMSAESTPLMVDKAELPGTAQGSGSMDSYEAWLDGVYTGLRVIAPVLAAAGATSSAQLAELAYLSPDALDDFVASPCRALTTGPADSMCSGRARARGGGRPHAVPPGRVEERRPLALWRRRQCLGRSHVARCRQGSLTQIVSGTMDPLRSELVLGRVQMQLS